MSQDLILYHLLEQFFEDYMRFKKELQEHFKANLKPNPASQLNAFYLSCVEKLENAHVIYCHDFPPRRVEDIQESFDLLCTFIRSTPEFRTFAKNEIDFAACRQWGMHCLETEPNASFHLSPYLSLRQRYFPQRLRSPIDYSKWLSALNVTALTVALVLMMGFIGIYFILQITTDAIEQILFHEGWQHAIVTLLGTAMSAYIVSEIANCIIYMPLLHGAVYLGFSNPIGLATFGWLSAMLAGGALLAIFIEHYVSSSFYSLTHASQSLSGQRQFLPLTPEETLMLKAKQLDLTAVKCALMLGYITQENGQRPSWLSRFFSPSNSDVQAQIEHERALRRGETVGRYVVSDFEFHVCMENTPQPQC